MRAIFSSKKFNPISTVKIPTSLSHDDQNFPIPKDTDDIQLGSLEVILDLPMPKLLPDSDYDQMDAFTAASLNSEIIQRYIRVSSIPNDSVIEINKSNVHKWTPLMYAAYLGHKEMAQLLLSKEANVETENKNGQTAIMMAASCGSVDVVAILLKYFSKIGHCDKYGRTCLHYAIKYNQAKIAELLLSKGADPNLADFEGMTPTLMACEVGNDLTVSELLKYNGNPNICNKRGQQGAFFAIEHPKIMSLLQKRVVPTQPVKTITKISTENDVVDLQNFVTQLLHELALDKYIEIFNANKIETMDDFLNLNENNLNSMGITLFGPRKKLLEAIKQHKSNQKTSGQANALMNCNDDNKQVHCLKDCFRDLQQLEQLCTLQQCELRAQLECISKVRDSMEQLSNHECSNCSIYLNSTTEAILNKLDKMTAKLTIFLEQSQ